MIKVSKVEHLGGHRLRFRFNDDTVGEYDFARLVAETGPMVQPLRDQDYFRRVFLDHGAPTWPNGFDLAPEWLHREIEAVGALSRATLA
jgi:hypothetical protein